MPSRSEIQQRILTEKNARAEDRVRIGYLKELHAFSKRDTILYASAFTTLGRAKSHEATSVTLADGPGFMSALNGLHGSNLDLILHSPGGSMDAAEQIVKYLRTKYRHIRAIIPQNAMSAATMIACACDEIVMGKHSAIGPIDPQVNGIPAQAILDEFEQAKQGMTENPMSAALWIQRMRTLEPGMLKICRATLDLSEEKVAEWLSLYMLKGNDGKAKHIAKWLSNYKLHKTHSRPIMMDDASQEGLKIIPLESSEKSPKKSQKFQDLVLSVFHATMETFEISDCVKIIENHVGGGSQLSVKSPK